MGPAQGVYSLAPTGKKILILERGGYVRREKANWDSHAVNVEGKYQTKEQWRDKSGHPLHPHTNYYVGGNTKFYGAALFRLRREDFGEIRHFGGISPSWPISYDDLEPYYMQAERLYHVHGQRGEDPTEAQASGHYPHPPISHEPRIEQLSEDFARQGLQPFHTPLGLQIDEARPVASKCIRCDTCDGYPCLVDAKSDAQVVCVDPALRFPNVSLMTDSYVERLETCASGREVSRVIVRQNGNKIALSAGVVVVSCGAINSAALLLRSANDKHPHGLANSSDMVGRHYMGHVNSVMLALSKCPLATSQLAIESSRFMERAMGIELYPKFLSLTEIRCYQPLHKSIVTKCCQTGPPRQSEISSGWAVASSLRRVLNHTVEQLRGIPRAHSIYLHESP